MKLGTAVTILNDVYKPLDQWDDFEIIPDDLLKNETIKEAWSVVARLRGKYIRIQHNRRVYRHDSFDRLYPRKDEIIADIKSGLKIKELNDKYEVSNIYMLFDKLGIKTLYKRMSFLQKAIFAYKDGEVLVFKSIRETVIFLHTGKEKLISNCLKNGEKINGYKVFRYEDFIKFYPEHEEIFRRAFKEYNL